jgi:hypothetical protein
MQVGTRKYYVRGRVSLYWSMGRQCVSSVCVCAVVVFQFTRDLSHSLVCVAGSRRHGKGRLVYPDGRHFDGMFEEGT